MLECDLHESLSCPVVRVRSVSINIPPAKTDCFNQSREAVYCAAGFETRQA